MGKTGEGFVRVERNWKHPVDGEIYELALLVGNAIVDSMQWDEYSEEHFNDVANEINAANSESIKQAVKESEEKIAKQLEDYIRRAKDDEEFNKKKAIREALEEARKEERERCAKVAENLPGANDIDELWTPVRKRIAAAIREGKG